MATIAATIAAAAANITRGAWKQAPFLWVIIANIKKKPVFYIEKSLDIKKNTGYNTKVRQYGQILALGATEGQKSKRRCKQHG